MTRVIPPSAVRATVSIPSLPAETVRLVSQLLGLATAYERIPTDRQGAPRRPQQAAETGFEIIGILRELRDAHRLEFPGLAQIAPLWEWDEGTPRDPHEAYNHLHESIHDIRSWAQSIAAPRTRRGRGGSSSFERGARPDQALDSLVRGSGMTTPSQDLRTLRSRIAKARSFPELFEILEVRKGRSTVLSDLGLAVLNAKRVEDVPETTGLRQRVRWILARYQKILSAGSDRKPAPPTMAVRREFERFTDRYLPTELDQETYPALAEHEINRIRRARRPEDLPEILRSSTIRWADRFADRIERFFAGDRKQLEKIPTAFGLRRKVEELARNQA